MRKGFLAFGEFPSDHRAIWVDLSYDNAFGHKMPKIISPRKLKSDDPRTRNRWIELYKSFVSSNKLNQKIFDLEKSIYLPITNQHVYEYEKIRKKRDEGIKYADKRCRKLKMGNIPYSDELRISIAGKELWRAALLRINGGKYSNRKINRLEITVGIQNSLRRSREEVNLEIIKADKHYKTVKKMAKRKRISYLEAKAKSIADEQGHDRDNVYLQLIKREKQREAARRIKLTLGKLKGLGVTKVDILKPDGGTEELTTKSEIEAACMEENNKKYKQTRETPCMTMPLRGLLGFDGNTSMGRDILRGNFSVPEGTPQ